jgi:predicted TIM-barrel fold metal-dependent hydrolase
MANKPYVVALEEHYHDPQLVAAMGAGMEGRRNLEIARRLDDLGALRLKEMDEAGIDYQVLSHGAPATQRLPAESALQMARALNDRLHQAVAAHPKRFGAFGALPTTTDAKLAADELERCVAKLGFVGAMIHGLSNGVFLDDKRFWPIFERAQALDVPLYFHPASPHPDVAAIYLKDYLPKHPALGNAAWGFTIETATLGIRLILSGVLDAYPKVKIILGHLGEGLPFFLWRIDMALARDGKHGEGFRDKFLRNFYVTTSGFFSSNALDFCIKEIGLERILFSIDYPFVLNPPGTKWALEELTLDEPAKEKLLSGNARRLLKLKV